VLSSLPSTRPQRPSARRAAARQAAARSAAAIADPHRAAKAQPPPGARPSLGRRVEPDPGRVKRGAKRAAGRAKPDAQHAKPDAERIRPTIGHRPSTSTAAPAESIEPPAPPQGFETEDVIEPGSSVHPPSGAELAASVAELVGELAHAGLSVGGRVLRDTLTRLAGT
jgi:hypothetical protein